MLPPKDVMNQMKADPKERFNEDESPSRIEYPNVVEGFGPPDFEKNFNNQELEESYRQFEDELVNPDIEENHYEPQLERPIDDDEEYGFAPPPPWKGVQDYPKPPSLKQENNNFLHDDEIFKGGPSRTQVMSWKKQFEVDDHRVFLNEISGEHFIWRTLNRAEYREIMALPDTDPLQREELICEICTLFPYDYNFTSMTNRRAGIPAVLAQLIMQESGFQEPSPPIRL